MTNDRLPKGVWPVMLTAFHADGSIDWDGVSALVDWYIEADIAGLFAVCLSSEMYTLTPEERLALAAHVVKQADDRVPVVAPGTFAETADNHTEFIRRMSDTGVNAVVLMPCQLMGEDAKESELRGALETLAEGTASVDLGLYECPAPYHRLIPTKDLKWAAETGRFIFLKETSAQQDLLQAKCEAVKNTRLHLYNAHSPSLLIGLKHGAAGCSNIAANLYPQLFAWLCENYRTHAELADELGTFLAIADPLARLEYPAGAKDYLGRIGLPITATCRLDIPRGKNDDLSILHQHLHQQIRAWQQKLGTVKRAGDK